MGFALSCSGAGLPERIAIVKWIGSFGERLSILFTRIDKFLALAFKL